MCKFKLNIDEWSRAKGPEIYLAKYKNLIFSILEPESNERLFDKCCLTSGGFPGGIAAAAAKSLQSCPTLWDPIEGSPPGSPIPGILQARTLEWIAISFSNA